MGVAAAIRPLDSNRATDRGAGCTCRARSFEMAAARSAHEHDAFDVETRIDRLQPQQALCEQAP